MIKIKITNLNRIRDLKIGLSTNDQLWVFSFSNPGLWNWIVVDKKRYKKKVINIQYELSNLTVKCLSLIRNSEVIINNNKCAFRNKLPIIKDTGEDFFFIFRSYWNADIFELKEESSREPNNKRPLEYFRKKWKIYLDK